MTNTLQEIKQLLKNNNIPDYRYDQILNEIFKQRNANFKNMQGLPKKLRQNLENKFGPILALNNLQESVNKNTKKILFQLEDKQRIEAVLMHYPSWKTLCISTQVGCRMACSFCATGKIGLKRNLTVDEIISQPLYFHLNNVDLHSVSLMGMGEPLDNPNTFPALEILTNNKMFNFGSRNVNVSTIGLIPGLKKLINNYPQINIVLSLHSAIKSQRKVLIPASKNYPLCKVMEILDRHIYKNKRKVFLAYLLLKDINDTTEHIRKLAALINSRKAIAYLYHVNLVAYNSPANCKPKFKLVSSEKMKEFKQKLESKGINVSIRKSFGQKISAGCGQLYADYKSVA